MFDKFSSYLSLGQIAGFADDIQMRRSLREPVHFHNGCAQVGFILQDLKEVGMQVSTDNTVILLALSGPSYDKVKAPFIHRTKRDRFLQETTSSRLVSLPTKTSHTCLGVKNMGWVRQGLTKLAQPRAGPTKLGSSGLAGSLGHLTHEANYDLHVRLGFPDPIAMLRENF